MDTLKCSLCKTLKPLDSFQNDKKNKNRQEKHYWCTQCFIAKQKQQKYYASESKMISRLIESSKVLAKTRGKNNKDRGEFDIDRKFIQNLIKTQDNKCAISGMDFVWEYNNSKKVSIDRIDCNKGYTKDNVRLVCQQVNMAINEFNLQNFFDMCLSVVIHNNMLGQVLSATSQELKEKLKLLHEEKCSTTNYTIPKKNDGKHSEELKQNIKLLHKENCCTTDYTIPKKNKQPNKNGGKHSEETKEKIRQSIIKWHDEKTTPNSGSLKKGDSTYNSTGVTLTKDGEVYKCNSFKQASRIIGCSHVTVKKYAGRSFKGYLIES